MVNKKAGEVERLPLTDDYIFKRVFAFEGNESVLKDLLEAILRRDIKAETDDGTVLDIEMQMEDKRISKYGI